MKPLISPTLLSCTLALATLSSASAQDYEGIVYGASDTCDDGRIEMIVDRYTDCRDPKIGGNRAWSIKVGGVCKNISDTTVQGACLAVKATHAKDVVYGATDSCDDGKIEQIINPRTDCSKLSATARAWSVKVGGQCRNITDTNVRSACLGVKTENAKNVVYGRTDSCDPSHVAAVINRFTRCEDLSATESAWSARIDGKCQNITDTSVRSACLAVRASGGPDTGARVIVYGATDSCDNSRIEAILEDGSQCAGLSDTARSWSIKVDGACKNISDTNVRSACTAGFAQSAQNIVYGRTDSCDNSHIIAILDDYNTYCEDLSETESSWSVKINGVCKNISDTNAVNACRQIQVVGIKNAIYGRSDSCDDREFLMPVTHYTDCNAVDANQSVWSVKVNGVCKNITDTNIRSACLLLRTQM